MLPEVLTELQNILEELRIAAEELGQQDEEVAVAGKAIKAENHQVEAELRESEQRYRLIAEHSTDMISKHTLEGIYLYASPACRALLGYEPDELVGRSAYEFFHPEDLAEIRKSHSTILDLPSVYIVSYRIRHKDGNYIWFETTSKTIRDPETGTAQEIIAVSRNITKHKRIEAERERLLVAEREQRLLAETLGEVFLALTSQTSCDAVLSEILYQAQRVVPYSGAHIMLVENETLRSARWRGYETFGNEEFLANLEQSLANFPLDAEAVKSGRSLVIPDTQQNSQWVTVPELAWIKSFVAVPICLHDRVLGLLRLDSEVPDKFSAKDAECLQPLANAAAIALENARLYDQMQQELAERIQAEKELRRVVLRNQAILDAIPDSMFCFSREGELLIYKLAHHSDLPPGILGETIIGKKLNELLPSDLVDLTLHYIGQTLDSGIMQAFEYQLSLPDGPQDFEARLVVSGTNEVLAIVRNITTRKQMEEALKKSKANLAASEARLLAEMQSVLVINQALVSEINLNTLLEFIITQAEHLLNADGAAVLFLSEDGQYLEVATPGESWLRIRPGSRVLVGGSLAERAIITRQTQTSNHVLGDSRTESMLALLESAQVSSLLCAPLLMQSKSLGVLLIWGEHEQVFDTQDSRLMNLFANQAALALHNVRLHALNRQLAIEQERHRLARELHDSVTQSLHGIGLAAQTSLKLLGQDADSRVRYPIERIYTMSRTALTEMREQLYHLHPTVLNEDLVEALTQYCNELRRQHILAIEFTANLKEILSIEQRDTLYYIAREALWNIVKHAKATRVSIVLTSERKKSILSIKDDGVGFIPSDFTGGITMGLRNMEERAKLLGGDFELQSTPGHGTQLMVRIPASAIQQA
jgi:PAS domain S-box-containing protein